MAFENENMYMYYREIKNIINCSYYESCSNVMVESIFNGCNYINKNNLNNHLQLLTINPNNKNILFIDIFRDVERLEQIIKITKLYTELNVYFMLFIDKKIDLEKFTCNFENISIYFIENNNYNNNDIKCVLKNNFEKIYIFDYKLSLVLKNYINQNDLLLCLLKYKNDKIENLIIEELNDYYMKKIIQKYSDINIHYRKNIEFKNIEKNNPIIIYL